MKADLFFPLVTLNSLLHPHLLPSKRYIQREGPLNESSDTFKCHKQRAEKILSDLIQSKLFAAESMSVDCVYTSTEFSDWEGVVQGVLTWVDIGSSLQAWAFITDCKGVFFHMMNWFDNGNEIMMSSLKRVFGCQPSTTFLLKQS